MTWTSDLLTGLAEYLGTHSIGTWAPDETDGTIHLHTIPSDASQGIGLTAYNLQPDHALADVIQPVQVMLRGPAAWVDDTADVLFDLLEGSAARFGAVDVWMITLYSDVRLGIDDKGRTQRALNYYLSANRPTAYRPD